VSTHDLDELRRGLQAIPDLATLALRRLEDLHTVAFDRRVNGSDGAGRSTRLDWALDEIGERDAKDVWRRALRMTHDTLVEFSAVCVAISELLNAGGRPDPTMRGTMLGDEQTGASAELARLVKAQQERHQRGEYTPHREWTQPKVPRR
jgi:hypothetical protein